MCRYCSCVVGQTYTLNSRITCEQCGRVRSIYETGVYLGADSGRHKFRVEPYTCPGGHVNRFTYYPCRDIQSVPARAAEAKPKSRRRAEKPIDVTEIWPTRKPAEKEKVRVR